MGDSNHDIEAESKSAEEVGTVESTSDGKIPFTPEYVPDYVHPHKNLTILAHDRLFPS